ncbi:TolC family protein [Sinanaerobacter sp. ZZT-01]|uniref:TolC family protein n=1 Tax=Sinanaerobacter sp. ZZT-01 TaxID=3111540 RepID=UPI002D79F786|nr:TolC family protein [Sinanaerobacter sp. ZZT-01]WRR94879.1 TolC family protein [Sinanaerobacter sp. ZZT-01]
MKRKLIIMLLSVSLLTTSSLFCFAAEALPDTNTAVSIAPTMDFVGTSIKLSLSEAVKHMQTEGVRAETAKNNKDYDKALSSGYTESIKSFRDTINDYSDNSDIWGDSRDSKIEKKVAELKRDFAKANLENNYAAEMNKIESDTITSYYKILQAEDILKSSQDNLKIQKSILETTQKKFDLGLVSKNDLDSAKASILSAEFNIKDADATLKDLKMNFNLDMGYPLMQKVTFSDTLKELDEPKEALSSAIDNGLSKRMEIKNAALGLEVQKILLESMKYTISTASSKYAKQKIALSNMEQALEQKPLEIEKEIRSAYMDIQSKKSALDSAKASKVLAEDSYHLAMISYNAGVKTLTDVQEAQLKAFEANQSVAAAITAYDLSIYTYQYAQNVGTQRIDL